MSQTHQRPRDAKTPGAMAEEVSAPMHADPNELLDAASAVVDAAQPLFREDENGSHLLIGFRVPAEPMIALMKATAAGGKGDDA